MQALFIITFILSIQFLPAQTAELDPGKWASELSKKDRSTYDSLYQLTAKLQKADSLKAFQFLDELAKKGRSKGDHFQALFNCVKARIIYYKSYWEFYQNRPTSVNIDWIKQQLMKLYSSAIDIAYRSEYDMLPAQYQFLAELLYRVREYNECIRYGKKAVTAWQKSPNEFKPFTVSSMNTVALGYHRQQDYDSALIFYNQALALAKQTKDTVWTGIVSGNIGQILYAQGKYDT